MKTMGMVLGLAALGAVGTSCHFAEPVIQPIAQCVGYMEFNYWYEVSPPTLTVCTSGEVPGVLQFKGPDGTPVPGGGQIEAPGCLTLPIPPSAATVDWVQAPRDGGDEGGTNLVAPPQLPGSVAAGVLHGFVEHGAGEYVFGCAPLKGLAAGISRMYEVAAMATSLAEAQSLVSPAIYHGAGSALPPGVTVHYTIEAEQEGQALVIRSSLVDGFDRFEVAIDGQTVADSSTGLNVEVTHPGARWTTVVATLPLSLLSETMDLTLRQQGEHDPSELQMSIDF